MIVSNTTTSISSQVNSTSITKSVSDNSFTVNNETKKAVDISYEDYKNLSVEDIEKLYPKDSMPDENKKALSLHLRANMSNDEILNKVLFDKELESKGSKAQEYVSDFLDSMSWIFDSLKSFEINDKNSELINLPHSSKPIDAETLKAIEADKKRWDEWRKEDKVPVDFLFSVFDNQKTDFYENQEYYKESKSTFRAHGKEILDIYNSIKTEYEKRTNEANSTLNSYMKNNKPNILNT